MERIYYNPKEVGRQIGEVRRNAGLKQWELAMELHITRDMLARIETGKNTCGPDYLMYLCQRFGKTADYFYFGTENTADDKTRVSIQDNKIDFYEQAFSTLFHRHDAMKKGKFKREIESELGYEDFKKVFSYFCFRSFFKNQYEFTENSALENIAKAKEKVYSYGHFDHLKYLNDMTKAVCMLIHEGLNYRFSHRSFQEYFAAVYTMQLSDEEQKQFVTSWLRTMEGRMTTDFLDILLELQPDRFMKNILYDALCELYNLYDANGKSDDWFLNFMYDGISLHSRKGESPRIYVSVNESYYHTVFVCMLRYLHYEYKDMSQENGYQQTVDKLRKTYKHTSCISFQTLKEDGLYDQVKEAVKWVFVRKDCVFNALDKVDVNAFGKKRKFEAMLEEL